MFYGTDDVHDHIEPGTDLFRIPSRMIQMLMNARPGDISLYMNALSEIQERIQLHLQQPLWQCQPEGHYEDGVIQKSLSWADIWDVLVSSNIPDVNVTEIPDGDNGIKIDMAVAAVRDALDQTGVSYRFDPDAMVFIMDESIQRTELFRIRSVVTKAVTAGLKDMAARFGRSMSECFFMDGHRIRMDRIWLEMCHDYRVCDIAIFWKH